MSVAGAGAHAGLGALEEVVLGELGEAAAGRGKRARIAEGCALTKPVAKRLAVDEAEVERLLSSHAALAVRDVRATRLFGFFKLTRPARAVALRTPDDAVRAMEAGAGVPASAALAAYVAGALARDDAAAQEAAEFDLAFPRGPAPLRSLRAVSVSGEKREGGPSETAGGEAARAKSLLSRLRRPAAGGGFELSDRSRVSSAMGAVEAVLQASPDTLARALGAEDFERWLRDACKERELADIATATRLRAAAERMSPQSAKALFVRLLSFSPVREAVALGVVPAFVARLTSASKEEVEQIVDALEGLGSEGVLESLVKAVYEVPAEARPRVLMAMGAFGSPRVVEPLTRLALHSQLKADRLEAAAAVLRIAKRAGAAEEKAARHTLRSSEDPEVRAMVGGA